MSIGNYNQILGIHGYTRELNMGGGSISPRPNMTVSNGGRTIQIHATSAHTNPFAITSVPLLPGKKYHFEWVTDAWGSEDTPGTSTSIYLIPISKIYETTGNINTSGQYYYYISSWKPARGIGSVSYFDGSQKSSLTAADAWQVGETISLDIDMSTIGSTDIIAKNNGTTFATDSNMAFLDEPYLICPQVQANSSGREWTGTFNFGATAFTTTPVADHTGIYSSLLPEPTVKKPDDFYKTVIYTGNGSTQSITDVGFQPDFVWIKNRDQGDDHVLFDSIRGAAQYISTTEGGTSSVAETTDADTLTSFTSNGFNIGDDDKVNTNTEKYMARCWKAGGAPTVDNNNTSGAMDDGSVFKSGAVQNSYTPSGSPSNYPRKMTIASHGGFSIVEYVGTGANATVPHGLDRTPDFFMVKCTDHAFSFGGYHSAFGTGSGNDKTITWNSTGVATDQSGLAWQNNPFQNNHCITFGSQTGQNGSGDEHIMYIWARTPGLIGIGSYIGNGNSDGPGIVIEDGASGFMPAWVMFKNVSAAGYGWNIYDVARETFNPMQLAAAANSTPAEGNVATTKHDWLSNGFKIRGTAGEVNGNGNVIIYLAMAEHPFGGDGVSQARAR